MQAVTDQETEPVEVQLCGSPVPATRVTLDAFEAVEFQHETETIVYCGLQGSAGTSQFSLDRPARSNRSSEPVTAG